MDSFSLASTYLLKGATIGDIDAISSVSELKDFGPGEPIVADRESDRDILVVVEGRARVETREGDLIGELRRGDMIGEISFLDGKGRSANVMAAGQAKVMVIPGARLRELMDNNPALELVLLRNVSQALCGRLRDANQQVEALLVPR